MSSADRVRSSDESELVDTLFTLGELRSEWCLHPRSRRLLVSLCAAMGAWGVFAGWAVFILLWEKGQRDPLTFLLGLAAAAVVSLVAETMRELILHGRVEAGHQGGGPRIVTTVLMLAAFELFVMAFEGVAEKDLSSLKELAASILGPVLPDPATGWWDFGVLAGLWIAVGAAVSGLLSKVVLQTSRSWKSQLRHGVKVGAAAGLVVAPLGVVAYILLVRAVGMVLFMVKEHRHWEDSVDHLIAGTSSRIHLPEALRLPLLLIRELDRLGHVPLWGPAVLLLGGAAIAILSWKARRWDPLKLLGAAALLVVLAPLLADLKSLLLLPLLAAVIWGVPGVLLGALAPFLKRAASAPRIWGLLAFVSAAVIAGLTLLRLAHPVFLIPALLLVLTGFLFHRGSRVEDYWPLVALCIAMIVCGATFALQQATFLGVLEKVHAIHNLPQYVGREPARRLASVMEGSPFGPTPGDEVSRAIQTRTASLAALPAEERFSAIVDLFKIIDARLAKDLRALWETSYALPYSGRFSSLEVATQPISAQAVRDLLSRPLSADEREIHALGTQMTALLDLPLEPQKAEARRLSGVLERRVAEEEAGRLLSQAVSSPATTAGASGAGPDAGPPADALRDRLTAMSSSLEGRTWQLDAIQDGLLPLEAFAGAMTAGGAEKPGGRHEKRSDTNERSKAPDVVWGAGVLAKTSQEWQRIEWLTGLMQQLGQAKLALVEPIRWQRSQVARLVELALTGSLGFWVTVGLLAGWSIRDPGHQQLVERHHSDNDQLRCFWANDDWRDFHDGRHGVPPADDRELYERLSLEILAGGDAGLLARETELRAAFRGFDPDATAGLDAAAVLGELREEHPPSVFLRAPGAEEVSAVIENARRLRAHREARGESVAGQGSSALLQEWRERAHDGPEALLRHVRSCFEVPDRTPLGSFLQSVALLPGAHFHGCFRA